VCQCVGQDGGPQRFKVVFRQAGFVLHSLGEFDHYIQLAFLFIHAGAVVCTYNAALQRGMQWWQPGAMSARRGKMPPASLAHLLTKADAMKASSVPGCLTHQTRVEILTVAAMKDRMVLMKSVTIIGSNLWSKEMSAICILAVTAEYLHREPHGPECERGR
jgi:hypothetical protein